MFCDIIKDVSRMSLTSTESSWSEVSGLWQTKSGDHLVALWSKMNENLKIALKHHLVNQFWWYLPQKIWNFLLISNLCISCFFLLPKVKLESNRRIKVKSGGLVEMNPIYKYMFRLFYFWIQIQDFSRSLRVIRGQTWGNPSNRGQIGRLVAIY